MPDEVARRFIREAVDDTRCPELIRGLGVKARHVYLLRKRIDCGRWDAVRDLFREVKGRQILIQPAAARKYFTTKPRQVIKAMKKLGIW
jgi:hypothetical protein